MSESFYFLQAQKNESNSIFLDNVKQYSTNHQKQIYLIDRPLGNDKYYYDFDKALVLLSPGYKLLFINFSQDTKGFNDFMEDFIEDLGFISNKYQYKKIIDRPKYWKNNLVSQENFSMDLLDITKLLIKHKLEDDKQKKTSELLISLLTGSVNNIDKVKGDVPNNILDKIKQKIILFDGDQTRFVYQKQDKKRVTIQGLSGTGKTELLLHKLKEIYVNNKTSKIAFTCHNKILASELKKRVPLFFNIMKVEEQIKWNERLWCTNAWGKRANKDTGIYSYITNFYGLQFSSWNNSTTFDAVCKSAINELKKINIEEKGYAFDFVLIDESQDFKESFFKLCEMVTKTRVYIAGDIFQSIFDSNIVSEITPDFLLSKCYRTDPRTLMFAHAIGMGLFESPKLRWLEDNEWQKCGYILNKNKNQDVYTLKREPLRRFEDLENENISSMDIIKTSVEKKEESASKIIEIIKTIKSENPTVSVEDIAIIYIDNFNYAFKSADRLEELVPLNFDWSINKASETKDTIPNTLFVSNKNNVKGLEFPFVICVTKTISSSRSYRNALYMMLTRSFIKSYLLVSQDTNFELLKKLESGLSSINKTGEMKVSVPNQLEQDQIKTTFLLKNQGLSFEDYVFNIFDDLNIEFEYRSKLYSVVQNLFNNNFDEPKIRKTVVANYDLIRYER